MKATRSRPPRVAGERVDLLVAGLSAVERRTASQAAYPRCDDLDDLDKLDDLDEVDGFDDVTAVDVRLVDAVSRAMLRVEAELLQRDARVWDLTAQLRTPADRRLEAYVLLTQRVGRSMRRTAAEAGRP